MLQKNHKSIRVIIGLSASALLFILAGVVLFNRQFISDSIESYLYEPDTHIAQLSDDIQLTADGKRIFYATQPEASAAGNFNYHCPRQEEKNPIIGCYTNADRIFIYEINNEELEGIEQVTVAHEMLHAAWARMSSREQKRVGNLLIEAFQKTADGELKTRMEYYERTEPGQFTNELHSIIGTEVKDLSNELEDHYAQYFANRTQVVDYFNQYDSVYRELYDSSEKLYAQLQSLNEKITSELAQYDAAVESLNADIESFNNRADKGQFSTQSAFYAERSTLIDRSNSLEALRQSINADITQYESLRAQYIEVTSKIEKLNSSLDSFSPLESSPSL